LGVFGVNVHAREICGLQKANVDTHIAHGFDLPTQVPQFDPKISVDRARHA